MVTDGSDWFGSHATIVARQPDGVKLPPYRVIRIGLAGKSGSCVCAVRIEPPGNLGGQGAVIDLAVREHCPGVVAAPLEGGHRSRARRSRPELTTMGVVNSGRL